ncbi:replicative DNA helicase [Peterkaempfera bronchialis]|uniref:replicative DNA helicase n=1 Tax=Peterkaempfera bronchialis TaxID=2126346 RepID=UPI003C2BE5F8
MTGPQYDDHDTPPPPDDDWPAPGDSFPDGPGDRLPVPRNRRDGGRNPEWRGDRNRDRDRDRDGDSGGSRGGDAFERVPPQDLAAEQSVLGGMLLSKDAIADVVEVLKPADYYRPAHELIHGAILDLYARGEPADPITVAGELTKRGEITRAGGPAYLHTLVNSVPTAANAEYYAEIVHERAVLRRLVEAGTRIAGMGYAAEGDVDEIVNAAQAEIYAVTEQRTSEDYAPLADIMEGALDEIEAIGSRSGQMSGVPTGFTDLDSLTNGLHPGQMIVVAARPAMGKCITGKTLLVEASTGRRIPIEEFVRRGREGESLKVHTLGSDWRLRPVEPSDFVPNGRRAVFRLTTQLGRSLSATPNHPLLTLRGWRPLEQLEPGDRIAVARTLPTRGGSYLPDDLVGLTGYLLGDGCLAESRTSPTLRAMSQVIVADARRMGEALGLDVREHDRRPCTPLKMQCEQPEDEPHIHPTELAFLGQGRGWNLLAGKLGEWGLKGVGARDKFVPEVFFQLPARQIGHFLSRLYATDGWACVSKPGNQPQVGYCSVSERLARDVAHLLLRLGIVAKVVRRTVAYNGERRPAFQVLIHDIDQIRTFAARVGIHSKERQLAAVLGSFGERMAQPNLDLIPGEVWELIKAEKGELSWAEVSARTGRPRNHNWHVGQQLSRHRLMEIGKALDSQVLKDIADSDVQWDRVESVVPDGEAEVYDLTVDGTHNFVANDIVVHNSTLALDFARACSIKNGMPSVIFSLEMGRNEIAMRLLSAEARVALHHMRSGNMTDDDWTRLARRMPDVSAAPLYIDDSPNLSMMEIRAKCRRLKQRNDLRMVVIDYLQLMQAGGSRRAESRQQEVSEMSRNLKLLAKELEVPVIALSQLNRGPEQRTDKRPMVSDLRESGCVTATTRLLRADTGAEVTIAELMESGAREVPVWSVDGQLRLVARTLTHAFPSGVKEAFRVRLASGREVEATANHPFLTHDGWQPLGELSAGARVAVPRRIDAPLRTAAWPEPEVVMLAHLPGSEGLASEAATLPSEVFALPDGQVRLFLRHLWATGGSMAVAENGAVRIQYTTPSERLARDLQHLLLRLDLRAGLRRDGGAQGRPEWSVDISGADDQRAFLRQIGVRGAAAESVDAALRCLESARAATTPDTVPPQVRERVREAIAEPALATGTRLSQVAEILRDAELELLATSDVRWDPIVSIESIGEQPVYDATVLGTHNFIANGVVLHNSIEQDADMVILLHREDAYEKESPRAGEADLIVAKHRNGPTATITVAFQGHYSRFVDMANS